MPAKASESGSSIEVAYADDVRLETYAELTSDAQAAQLAEQAAQDQLDLVLEMTATTLREIAFQALAAEDERRCRGMLDAESGAMIDELCAEMQIVSRQMKTLVDGLDLTRAWLRTATARCGAASIATD